MQAGHALRLYRNKRVSVNGWCYPGSYPSKTEQFKSNLLGIVEPTSAVSVQRKLFSGTQTLLGFHHHKQDENLVA